MEQHNHSMLTTTTYRIRSIFMIVLILMIVITVDFLSMLDFASTLTEPIAPKSKVAVNRSISLIKDIGKVSTQVSISLDSSEIDQVEMKKNKEHVVVVGGHEADEYMIVADDDDGRQKGRDDSKNKTPLKKKKFRKNHTLPPLQSLIVKDNRFEFKDELIIKGKVQFLLDYAILGFGKCGTTTLSYWLQNSPQTRALPRESNLLETGRNSELVRELYMMKKKVQEENEQGRGPRRGGGNLGSDGKRLNVLQGFKSPGSLRKTHTIPGLKQYWPKTKIVVSVRHPMDWFRSLYNFYFNDMSHPKEISSFSVQQLLRSEGCVVCVGKARFHMFLAKFGKTPMKEEEIKLFRDDIRNQEEKDAILRSGRGTKNKIFFLETSQLSDKNETRIETLSQDLTNFLQLDQDQRLSDRPPHILPGKNKTYRRGKKGRRKVSVQESNNATNIDLCEEQYDPVREELMRMSRMASIWFRNYFMQSEDVIVSSKHHLNEIFNNWMIDPCEARRQ